MRSLGCASLHFPIERDPADAWPDFVGWRANYGPAAYTIAYAHGFVPADRGPGSRRLPMPPITPLRPPPGWAT